MNTNKTTFTLLSVLSLTMAGAGMTTLGHAASYTKEGTSATTNAAVTFTVPTENNTKPGIPGTDPDNPETPTDNPGSDSKALLKIVYMSDLNFNTHEVSATNKTYNADLIGTSAGGKTTPFMQISDNRGTAAGWNLKVKQDGEFKNKDGKMLTGAYVTFKAPTLLGFDGKGVVGDVTSSEAKLSTDGTVMPIMNAAKGSGNGMTYGQFGKPAEKDTTDGIQMTIIGGTALASEYATTVTWSLGATPV